MTFGIANGSRGRVAGVLLLGLLLPAGRQAWGQAAAGNYKIIDVPPRLLDGSPEEDKRLKMDLDRELTTVLRGDLSLDDASVRARFDGYVTRYYFGILTHPTHLSEWVSRREDFLERRLPLARSERVHTHVVDLVRRTMEGIVRDNFHPVARHNAMLIIGALNSQEAVMVGDGKRPPVPLLVSLKFMLDELNNPDQIDAVRVAALVGILRHVRIDRELPSGRRLVGNAETMIVDAMLNLLNAAEPPEGRTPAGHAWLQRRAADVLGMLGSVGQGRVVTGLEGVVANDKAPLAVRCSAADALGRLNYPQDAAVNSVELGKKLGAVAALACYQEIDRVEQQQARENLRKGLPPGGVAQTAYGSPPGYGMFGPASPSKLAGGGPLAYRIDLTRRRVKHDVLQVRRGLAGHEDTQTKGLLGLAPSGNGGKELQQLVSAVDAIIAVADDSSFVDHTALLTEIRAKVRKMEDDCGIVLSVEEEAVGAPDTLLNPLDGGLPEIPTGPPADEGQPALPEPGENGVPAPPAPAPAGGQPEIPAPPAPAPAGAEPEIPAPLEPAPANGGVPAPPAPANGGVPAPLEPAPAAAPELPEVQPELPAEPPQVPGT